MRNLYIILFLGFLSLNAFSQDRSTLAEVYFKKAKKSLVESEYKKVEKYLLKAKEYFGGITKEEVAVFGAIFFYNIADHEKAKEYFKAFFSLNKIKTAKNYTKMLLLYTDNLDALDIGVKRKTIKKEVIKTDVNKESIFQLDSLYLQAKATFKVKDYKASLNSIKTYFSLQPDKSSDKYQDMVLLLVEVNGWLEEIPEPSRPVIEETIEEEKVESVLFSIIEEVPVFPGCKGDKSELKKCFNKNIQMHFSKNFNADLPNQLGLPVGRKKVFIEFKIDREGYVIDIFSRAPHPKIKEEVTRVMKLLPNMKPGMQRGKPVGVKYTIPFTLIVEGDSAKKKN